MRLNEKVDEKNEHKNPPNRCRRLLEESTNQFYKLLVTHLARHLNSINFNTAFCQYPKSINEERNTIYISIIKLLKFTHETRLETFPFNDRTLYSQLLQAHSCKLVFIYKHTHTHKHTQRERERERDNHTLSSKRLPILSLPIHTPTPHKNTHTVFNQR